MFADQQIDDNSFFHCQQTHNHDMGYFKHQYMQKQSSFAGYNDAPLKKRTSFVSK
jgi:hypothetical protein